MLSSAAMKDDVQPDLKALFGARLRALREERGWSAEEAARLIGGMDRFYLCKIERGEAGVSIAMLARLAEVFGLEERLFFTFPGTTIGADIDDLLRRLTLPELNKVKAFILDIIAEGRDTSAKHKRTAR